MRHSALDLLELLADFGPNLTGSVLEGQLAAFADRHPKVFADSAKEVEIFLLNLALPSIIPSRAMSASRAVLAMETDTVDANLIIMPPAMERTSLKHRDGRPVSGCGGSVAPTKGIDWTKCFDLRQTCGHDEAKRQRQAR